MAFDVVDAYELLSDGLFSGTLEEGSITDIKRYSRLLSHGLLDGFPEVVVVSKSSGGLNDVGTAIRL